MYVCVQATTAGAASEAGAEGEGPEGGSEEGAAGGDCGGESQTTTTVDATPHLKLWLRRTAGEAAPGKMQCPPETRRGSQTASVP